MQRYELTLLHVTASCNWYESLNLHRNQTKVQVDPRHRPPLSVGPACLVHGSVWQYPQTCQATNPTYCGHLQPESLCNLQCFSLELILVCSISSYWTSWHWAEEGQQGPAAHVAPGPPHRSTRPFCSLFISAAALWKVKLLLSALLILNLQEPDGWQAGCVHQDCRTNPRQKSITVHTETTTHVQRASVWSRITKAAPPLHLRAAESETMWDKRGKLMRFWAGAKCNGTPWTFTTTSGRLDVITLNDFTAWVSY